MDPESTRRHKLGIAQQFRGDFSACDFNEMLANGVDQNVYGRYADVENLGKDISFGEKAEYKSSSTYKSSGLTVPTEEPLPRVHGDTLAQQKAEGLQGIKEDKREEGDQGLNEDSDYEPMPEKSHGLTVAT